MHGPSVTNARRGNVVNTTSVAEGGGKSCNYSRLPLVEIASVNIPLHERVVRSRECGGSGTMFTLSVAEKRDLHDPAWSQSADLSC